MQFIKNILNTTLQIIEALFKLILSMLSDLHSFRNKLVVFTCILVAIVVIRNNDYKIILAALGLLEIFLCYYFNNRKVKDSTSTRKSVSKTLIDGFSHND